VPDTADRARFLELLRKNTANYTYFFEHADDPGWLPLLVEAGFFRSPPPPERDEGWVRFPAWPESRYLIRIADQAPEEVVSIARGVPTTDNVRVHEDLMTIASHLPPPMAAQLARKEAKWLRTYRGPLMSLPVAAGELLAALGRGAQTSAAFSLADPLLRIVRADRSAGMRRRATSLVDDWGYGQIIEKAWPALMAAAPTIAFRFLCDRLRDVVRIGCTDPNGFDSSQVWRSAIEAHGQNLGHSLLDTLIDAIRDVALDQAATEEGLELALTALRCYHETLFRRVELHVLQHRAPPDLVVAALTDGELADDIASWHEYSELLRTRYVDLSPEQRQAVLDLIAAGPAWDAATEDDLVQHRRWKLMRFALIAEHLDGEPLVVYRELADEFGEPEHPAFLHYSTSWTGPTSPFGVDELKAMGPAGVARAVRQWTPPGGPESPTPEGLGRTLSAAVAAEPDRFAAGAPELIGLEATYVRGVLDGFAEAAKGGTALSWDPVLVLCEWVVEQPRAATDVMDTWDEDPHWGWARKQVAELLSQGFRESAAEIPERESARVWVLLEALAEDPDPTPSHEERFGGDNMDPLTLSINTTRGEALHAVVRYALWRERALRARDDFNAFDSLPEVAALLERHLDPAIDRSLAIRAVYGKWFAQFVRMDPEWARALAPRVFPADKGLGARFEAAWDAYIRYTPAWTDVFAVIHEAYGQAIAGLAPAAGDDTRDETAQRLGDHLFTFRVLGLVELEDDDLFARYWRAASTDVRRRVLEHVGWSLEKTKSALKPDLRGRFSETWDWIVTHAEETGETAPLAGFSTWLGAPQLDGRWLLKQALIVLGHGVHLDPAFAVYEALPALATDHPRAAVDVVRLMVTTDAEGWSISGSEAEVRAAVKTALEADDPVTRAEGRHLAELLLARGFTSFRELLAV
jgi:hypothetical protein